jgi:hypothetical protein
MVAPIRLAMMLNLCVASAVAVFAEPIARDLLSQPDFTNVLRAAALTLPLTVLALANRRIIRAGDGDGRAGGEQVHRENRKAKVALRVKPVEEAHAVAARGHTSELAAIIRGMSVALLGSLLGGGLGFVFGVVMARLLDLVHGSGTGTAGPVAPYQVAPVQLHEYDACPASSAARPAVLAGPFE